MANPIQRIVRLILDRSSAKQTEDDAKKSLGVIETAIQKLKDTASSVGDKFKDSWKESFKLTDVGIKDLIAKFKGVAAIVGTVFAIKKIKQFTKEIFKIGVGAEETGAKFEALFGREAGATLDAFIADWGRLAGLTKNEGRDMAAAAGAIAHGLGFAREESAQFSAEVLKLAGDISSFHNISLTDAFAAVVKDTSALKRLGIVISDADIEARALRDTGKSLVEELTAQETATARLSLITEGAGMAIGDLERSQDSTLNTTRRLVTTFRQIKEDIAVGFLPVMSLFISAWADATDGMTFASRAAAWVGDVLTRFVGGLQIGAVELNAFFRTIPARFRIWLGDEISALADWVGVAEGLTNKIRGWFGSDVVDWTSGLRESAARLRAEGEMDIVAFRALVEEETQKILRASGVAANAIPRARSGPSAPVADTPGGGGSGFRVPIENLDPANVSVLDTMDLSAMNLVGSLGEVRAAVRLINEESMELGTVATATGEILGAAFGAGIGQLAAGKAKQNAIMAAEQAVQGFVASLNPFTAPLAAGHYAAAGQFLGIAAGWGALAGATGGFSGGNGGGGRAGGFGGGRDMAGGASQGALPLGPELNVYFTGEGFDAINPKVQRVIYTGMKEAEKSIGGNARVRTFRGTIPQQNSSNGGG